MSAINSPDPTTYQHQFFIYGLSCMGCVAKVERHLLSLDGVKQVTIHFTQKKAIVETTAEVQLADLLQQVQDLGYETDTPQHCRFQIRGLSCAGCVRKVENKLNDIEGISRVFIHPSSHIAHIEKQATLADDVIIQAVHSFGYTATPLTTHQPQQLQLYINQQQLSEIKQFKHRFWLALLLTLPIFIVEMLAHIVPSFHHWLLSIISLQQLWITQFILSTLVLFFAGRSFFQQGLRALFKRMPDMNSLVAIGSGTAYLYSCIATFAPTLLPEQSLYVYYESATVIITLILLGRYIEHKAKYQVSNSIQSLLNLQAKTTRVLQHQVWQEISVEDLQINDIIEILPSEKIPTDAVVISGSSFVDESMMTGESVPIAKSPGDQLIGGTLNQHGVLQAQVKHIGQDTVLSQIIQSVEQAQNNKLPIQQLVDKITLFFVPVIILLAILTFALWLMIAPDLGINFAVINAVTVLIIACPCAMGLATPLSIMLGLQRSAELGILFRKSDALQKLKNCRVIAFDKTGTLTQGKPVVTDFIAFNDDTQQLLQLVASVEHKSEHPIAHAIVQYAQQQQLELLDIQQFQAHTGYGVTAYVQQQFIAIGSHAFMQSLNIETQAYQQQLQYLAQQAKTPLYIAINQHIVGICAIQDPIQASSLNTIQQLKKQQYHIVMISGDHQQTAQAIAQQLSINHVFAEVLPNNKAEIIQQLQQSYGQTAFVGDGTNDAPALAQADVGIAIGSGTDVAIETADLVLMSGHIGQIPTAIQLSHATMNNIRQNLFWAFIYNILLIPIAMGILYPSFSLLLSPMLASAMMAFSSVFVVFNALRLKNTTIHHR